MSFHQPNRAPESCREPLCGYLEQRQHNGEYHDRCAHGIPMHCGCAWHRTPEQIKAMHERDMGLTNKVTRRGL